MDQPKTVKRRCPECGARLRDSDQDCWLCKIYPATLPPSVEATPASESEDLPTISLSTALLLLTAVGVGLALFEAAPGWAIVYCIIMFPALFRTCFISDRKLRREKTVGPLSMALAFARSLVATVLVTSTTLLAILIALYATCALAIGPIYPAKSTEQHTLETYRVLAWATIGLVVLGGLTCLYLKHITRRDA